MEIKQKLSLDFGRDTHPITVFAKQNDKNSRYLEITPLNCGQNYELENGITARLQLTKADGHTVLNNATITNGVIVVELTEQALAAAGVAVAEIGLYKGEALLSSQNFYIDVEKAAFDSEAPVSSDEYNAFTEALGMVDGAVTSANTAAAKADTAAKAADTATTKANAATTAANTAAAKADTAATKAGNVNISAEQTATGATITVTDKDGKNTSVHIDTLTAVNTWEDVKNAVRLGLGATLFPIGYEFTTTDSTIGKDIIWVVRAHDHHIAANAKLTHTMTLEAKYVYSIANGTCRGTIFDAPEALYYAADGLAAGTYNFTVAEQKWCTADNGKTYQFTLTEAVPAGGQIALNMGANGTALEGKSVKTHPSVGSSSVIENATLTEGSEGTSLGTTDGNSNNVNHIQRVIFGSNNYAQSMVRQWINSAASAASAYAPTNIFDRPIAMAAGFMKGLPADFLAVVQPAKIPCRTNSVFEINSLDGTEFTVNMVYELQDKFFLLSRPEIYGTWDDVTYKDGELLEYYEGLTDTERKKYDVAGTARQCWLRSCFLNEICSGYMVNTTGSLASYYVSYDPGVAPACIIA